MQVREVRDDLVNRVRFLTALAVVALVVIGSTFWFVQMVHGSFYRELAESNRLRRIPLQAPRGLIFDKNGTLLVDNVPSYGLLIDRSRTRDLSSALRFAADILERPLTELEAALAKSASAPAFRPILLAEGLSLTQVTRFEVKRLEHPEFEVEVRHQRLYRHGAQTAHVLGYLGEVSEREIDSSQGTFELGDLVGKRGIEQFYDSALRGTDGERVVVVDSRGQVLDKAGGTPAAAGRPLRLSIDLGLQQEAQRQLQDKVGAVVALDPRTGEIRAIVSSPSYNPNALGRRISNEDWQAIVTAPHNPLQNRTVQNTYSPGSVFKIVVAAAGLAEGVVDRGTRAHCAGAATIYNHRFRCHRQAGHGSVNLEEAIKHSCDVYFYHLGQKLGIDRIARYSRLFGLGHGTGIDLRGEKTGLVPDPAWSLAARKHPWYAGETISVAIGQGPLLTTPLQVAAMMAGVANGGRMITPHLVEGTVAPPPGGLDLPLEVLDPVRRALWAVVNEPGGTGAASKVKGFEVAGKTGTVQVVSQATWTKNESLPFEKRDHAWFASFAPADAPELVVVVFVEHGGGGSKVAAPIAKALYEKYFRIGDDAPVPGP
jgi:penicillin-binding protein 2